MIIGTWLLYWHVRRTHIRWMPSTIQQHKQNINFTQQLTQRNTKQSPQDKTVFITRRCCGRCRSPTRLLFLESKPMFQSGWQRACFPFLGVLYASESPPLVPGCTDPSANNYNPAATEERNSIHSGSSRWYRKELVLALLLWSSRKRSDHSPRQKRR